MSSRYSSLAAVDNVPSPESHWCRRFVRSKPHSALTDRRHCSCRLPRGTRPSSPVACAVNRCLTPISMPKARPPSTTRRGAGRPALPQHPLRACAVRSTLAAVPGGLLGLPWSPVDGPARTGARDPRRRHRSCPTMVSAARNRSLRHWDSRRRRALVGRIRSRSASGAAGVRALVAARTARLSGRLELRTESLHRPGTRHCRASVDG